MRSYALLLIVALGLPVLTAKAEEDGCVVAFEELVIGREVGGEKKEGESIAEKIQEEENRSSRLKAFARKKAASLGTLALASFSGGVAASYEDEIKDLYNENVKVPFRRAARRRYLLREAGGLEKVKSNIAKLEEDNQRASVQPLGVEPSPESRAFLEEYEARVKKAIGQFRENLPITEQDVRDRKTVLEGLSLQLLNLEKIIVDLKPLVKATASESQKSEQLLLQNAEREFSNDLALWKIYGYLNADRMSEERELSKEAEERFDNAREFLDSGVRPKAYQEALGKRSAEFLELIKQDLAE